MKPIIAAIGALLLLGTSLPERGVDPLADLSWLSGAWVSEDGARWAEEWWTTSRGGMMLGAGRSRRASGGVDFKQMRIAVDRQGVAFWGSPGGAPAVRFGLTASTATSVSFAIPQHDYPTSIAYRRDGKQLVATISGPNGSRPQSWRYRRLN